MKIFINGFWTGFSEKTEGVHVGFFEELIKQLYKINDIYITTDIHDADILLESFFMQKTQLFSKNWKCTIFFSGEVIQYPDHIDKYTIVLCPNTNGQNRVICPLFLAYMYSKNILLDKQNIIPEVPLKNICAIISNDKPGSFRSQFISLLESRGIHVDMAGRFRNNIGHTVPGYYYESSTISFMKQYKIILALENNIDTQYITEKIVNPLIAGVVPVYYGTNTVTDYFNEERFIKIDINNIEKTISTIIEVLDSSEKWLNIVNKSCMTQDINDILIRIVERCSHIIEPI